MVDSWFDNDRAFGARGSFRFGDRRANDPKDSSAHGFNFGQFGHWGLTLGAGRDWRFVEAIDRRNSGREGFGVIRN